MSSPPRDQLITHSPIPVRRRSSTSSPGELAHPELRLPRLSPTLTRAYDPNDPQVRERQRTMDADMAIQLSMARRDTQSASPVELTNPRAHTYDAQQELESPSEGLTGFPSELSPSEQREINIARGEPQATPFVLTPTASSTDINAMSSGLHNGRLEPVDFQGMHHDNGHDPSLLVSQSHPPTYPVFSKNDQPQSSSPPPLFGTLPTYQAQSPDGPKINSGFDFAPMESFASAEKTLLGLSTPANRLNFKAPPRPAAVPAVSPLEQPSADHNDSAHEQQESENAAAAETGEGSSATPRLRQRKLSQSNPSPRVRTGAGARATKKGKGKMALFESDSALPHFFGSLGESFLGGVGNGNTGDTYAYADGTLGGNANGGILNAGHDRPYRFSFYSNALSATIHARSLSELPAEGQTFEQLFSGLKGKSDGDEDGQPASTASSYFPARTPTTVQANGTRAPPRPKSNMLTGGMIGNALSNTDVESMTWWLDIQSPTDEEMKMLSKVFTIHPLTTEDIQMEETREKIELFRSYYLVCFRSFDQDPYSPTHLEPLNMYIIVFREGILSFHFRPTPHPQNVRRRINQLKDYISVTSDWISYALIDDITDAFGPLIQGIEYEVDSIDELVLILKEAETTDMLRRIGTCRKKVMGLLRLMGNKADVVKGLAKRCNENWRVAPTSDIGLYLSDIQDHLITMTQNLNHYEKILSRSHSNYLAQISIEMTDANNQINDVLSKLTALGTVLIPMNLVTGLWGMNVHVPGEETEGLKWFASIIACLAAFALVGGYSTYKFMVRR